MKLKIIKFGFLINLMKKEKELSEKKKKKDLEKNKRKEIEEKKKKERENKKLINDKKEKENLLKESIKKELEKKQGEIPNEEDESFGEFSRLRVPEFSQFESTTDDFSDFRPEDVLMQQTVLSGGAVELEDVIEEESPKSAPATNDFYSSNKDQVTYNRRDEAYAPSEENGASKIDTGGYKATNKDNYDIAQREAETGNQREEFYDPTERVENERVGEIRVNTFKDNLESAATQNKKKNDFNPQVY